MNIIMSMKILTDVTIGRTILVEEGFNKTPRRTNANEIKTPCKSLTKKWAFTVAHSKENNSIDQCDGELVEVPSLPDNPGHSTVIR